MIIQNMGWALKGPRKGSALSENVKSFLTDQFNAGVRTWHKADATHIAKVMKTLKNINGQFVFLPAEWRTAKQIKSFLVSLQLLR